MQVDVKMSEYKQLVVVQGVKLKKKNIPVFENRMAERGFRVKVARITHTLPDLSRGGMPVKGTGGRTDVLFYIHNDDAMEFAVKRFGFNPAPRWWEDVVKYNNGSHLYKQKILDRYKPKW
jgi:ribosomal protein L24